MLPLDPAQDTNLDELEIVIPNCLQMGWCESPPYFCAASETARDRIQQLVVEPIGSLEHHKFEHYVLPSNLPFDEWARDDQDLLLRFLIEVYVDDFTLPTQDPIQLLRTAANFLVPILRGFT